jgi:hypothetical protein
MWTWISSPPGSGGPALFNVLEQIRAALRAVHQMRPHKREPNLTINSPPHATLAQHGQGLRL